MARSFLVETKFTAKDLVSSKMNRMNRGVGRFAANLTDSNHMLGQGLNRANRSINRGILVGIGALGTGLGFAAREFVGLDESIRGAGAKFKDLDTTSATYQQSLDSLEKKARDVAGTTEFMATDTAGALDKMAMAGMSSELSMSLLAGTTNLATAAGTDLTTAVDIATDTLGAFSLMTDDAGQAQVNLTRISDVMAKTTTTANTSLEQMFEAIQKGAPAFTDAGQKMETFAAFTGVLANAGIKGGEAGTGLRNVMLRLAKPVGDAAKLLKKLGVNVKDGSGDFRDSIDIIGDLEKGLKGMGTQQRTSALATIFGAKTITSVSLLLSEGSDKLRLYRESLIASAGASKKMADAMRGSLMSSFRILGSTLVEKGFQIVEVFEKRGGDAIKNFTEFIRDFDVEPIVNFLDGVLSLFEFLGNNWKILLAVAGAIKAVSIAIGIASIAAKVFGFTLMATPMGWIIGIVAALSAGVILLATNWDDVTSSMKNAWGFIKQIGASALGGVLRFMGIDTDIGKGDSAKPGPPVSQQVRQGPSSMPPGMRGAELPTSSSSLGGMLDINFNNKPDDVTLQSRNIPKGINVGIPPTESL